METGCVLPTSLRWQTAPPLLAVAHGFLYGRGHSRRLATITADRRGGRMISFTIFFQNPDPSCSFFKERKGRPKRGGLTERKVKKGGGLCIIDRREEARIEKRGTCT